MIYLTQLIRYATIYALGGVMIGKDDLRPSKEEPYGSVGDNFSAVQSYEDEFGQAIRWCSQWIGAIPQYDSSKNPKVGACLAVNKKLRVSLLAFAERALTPRQYQALTRRLHSNQAASGGRKLLKTMPASLKRALIDLGCYTAQQDGAHPAECWRIPKNRAVKLA